MELSQSHHKYQPESPLRLAGPLYLQVASHLRERINSGEWELNQSLPNELDLSANYKVSLGTMRKALELLTRQNLVVRHQGRGTFVQKNRTSTDRAFWPLSVSANSATSEVTDVSLITGEVVQANAELAALLSIQTGSPIVRLTCFTKMNTAAKSIDTIVVSASAHPTLRAKLQERTEVLPASIAELMSPVVRCSDRVMASVAEASQAEILNVKPGSPILSIERQAYDSADRLVMVITRALVAARSVDYAIQA